jgi:hypothetical protein
MVGAEEPDRESVREPDVPAGEGEAEEFALRLHLGVFPAVRRLTHGTPALPVVIAIARRDREQRSAKERPHHSPVRDEPDDLDRHEQGNRYPGRDPGEAERHAVRRERDPALDVAADRLSKLRVRLMEG